MTGAAAVTVLLSVILALGGYLFTFFHDRRKSQRSAQLDRVNRQIRELYGPMYALAHGTNRTWKLVEPRLARDEADTAEDFNDKRASWRLWMTEVFYPGQARMVELLFENADLLIDDDIPVHLLDLVAHYQSHTILQARWSKEGASPDDKALIPYPHQVLLEWAERDFKRLKKEQRRMLGLAGSPAPTPSGSSQA